MTNPDLQAALDALDAVVQSQAQRIRTDIDAIAHRVATLAGEARLPQGQREGFAQVRDALEKASKMVDNLLGEHFRRARPTTNGAQEGPEPEEAKVPPEPPS